MATENTESPDEIERAMKVALGQGHHLAKTILEAMQTSDSKEPWFGNLLIGILNCVQLDYRSVEIGRERSVFLMAWGRRNLLELKTITDYVLKSSANANEFKNDLAIDAKEFYEAFSKIGQSSHKKLIAEISKAAEEDNEHKEFLKQALQQEIEKGPQTGEVDAEANIFAKMMKEFGIEGKKPKRISEIAKVLKQQEEFDPMFKVCSKIMHRTVLSIASTGKGSLDEVIPFLYNSAGLDVLAIYQAITDHFLKFGVQPPETEAS